MIKSTILVVDDEPTIFTHIKTVIGETYQLHYAENGTVGLQQYREIKPDLIILDLQMPNMDGVAFLQHIDRLPEDFRSIIVMAEEMTDQTIAGCGQMGVCAFLRKPIYDYELKSLVKQAISARKNHLELKRYTTQLEKLVQHRTVQLTEKVGVLEETQKALSRAMGNLLTVQVAPGVFWLQIPEVELYILCGCPSEVVKHLMHKGLIHKVVKEGVTCETGPNAILLSEVLVQNGGFSNMAEFPVLQMLYRQGMIIPGHPNNTGIKPLLIGCRDQVKAQMEYIHRGNYGLVTQRELLECGVDEKTAENMMKVKMKFAFGVIRPPSELLDTLEVNNDQPQEIRNGVTVRRTGFNHYQFAFHGRTTDVDLNLPANVLYEPAYPLGNYRFKRQYFAILHRGDGDGWDSSRPSMGNIIMFQGRIYLVDAAPGLFYSMMALGIDISEVEGVFHTHAHDDHFAGLPALIHAGHRLKYYATAPVRSAVAKKFTSLMSLEEEKFGQFFEICDLTADTWNNCDGLEVKPFYSPHPTETNILIFRALDGDGYKSFAYWADLSSLKVMDNMVGEGSHDVPASFIEKVKHDYKHYANLKKLDIGGGMIHGVAEDFMDDPSDRLILSHVDRKLSVREMEIGSEAAFGALEVLIKGDQDYLYQRTFHYLYNYFQGVEPGQIHMLLNSPIVDYNVGTILHQAGDTLDTVDMVVAGTVAYLESEAGVINHLSFGSLIGMNIFFGKLATLEGTYRAFSHCSVIRFPAPLFQSFLIKNGILSQVESMLDIIWFLRKSRLFGEQISFASLGNIAKSTEKISISAASEIQDTASEQRIWLVVAGEMTLCNAEGKNLETIKPGVFFGEHTYLSNTQVLWKFRAEAATELYELRIPHLLEIPIIHWKLLEAYERRCRLFADT